MHFKPFASWSFKTVTKTCPLLALRTTATANIKSQLSKSGKEEEESAQFFQSNSIRGLFAGLDFCREV